MRYQRHLFVIEVTARRITYTETSRNQQLNRLNFNEFVHRLKEKVLDNSIGWRKKNVCTNTYKLRACNEPRFTYFPFNTRSQSLIEQNLCRMRQPKSPFLLVIASSASFRFVYDFFLFFFARKQSRLSIFDWAKERDARKQPKKTRTTKSLYTMLHRHF